MFGFHNTKEITGYYSGTETDRMPYIATSDNSTTTPVTIVEHENGEKLVTSPYRTGSAIIMITISQKRILMLLMAD